MDREKDGKKVINIDLDDSDTNDSNSENSTLQSESTSSNITSVNIKKINKKNSKALTEVLNDNMKFLNNFDPEQSNRERRKLTRKIHAESGKKAGTVYDENGILSGSEKDVCDCLVKECPGCHFPCPKCRSCKCGVDCRINRKWMYDAIENEGEITVTKNALALGTSVHNSQSLG